MKPHRAQLHRTLLADIAQALRNHQQRTALRAAADTFRAAREEALTSLPNLQELRSQAKGIRVRTMANLEFYLNQLTSNLNAVGARVFRASTAAEAAEYILSVAERNGVRLAVKSKSMTSEEIALNERMEAKGISVVETDLGERIIQMAGERPSHLIAPAIHKTRRQIADLFSKELKRIIPPDPDVIAQEARQHLRDCFLRADMGISGVNIAVAESGALILVTNEGNGRLVTSLPRVHVALMGCEKIVPTLEEAVTLLRLLMVSATGQKITSYVSIIQGPNAPAFQPETDHPKELHVVILDNGRFAARDDPSFTSALNCIRCAACLNVCPTYQVVGGHVFGDRYMGPIGVPWTAFTTSQEAAFKISPLCINCGLCRAACPVDVEIPEMIMELKHLDLEHNGTSRINRFISDFERLSALASATAPASNWLLRQGFTRILLEKIFGLDRRRRIPPYSRRRFTKQFAQRESTVGGGREVAYFADTYAEYNEPDLAWCVVEVLERSGFTVTLPPQRGAGMPLASYGFMGAFTENARFNVSSLAQLARRGVPIVASEPTAAYCLKHLYPYVLESEDSTVVAENSYELFEFLRLQDNADALPKDPKPLEGHVAYHAPCHTKALFSDWPVAAFLEKLGLTVDRVRHGCCGIGGTYGFKRGLEGYDVSMEIQRGLIEELNSLPVDFVVTESSVCRMQIEAGYSKPVVHPIRLVRDAYSGSKRGS